MPSAHFVPEGSGPTMRGWGMTHTTGDIADIQVVEGRIPTPGTGEIRVKMVAATTNPVDWKRAAFGAWPKYPAFFGVDGAGIVDALGEGVTTLALGDRVHFFNDVVEQHGTFAEYSIVRALGAVRIPDNVSWEDAAVVPCAGWTAYECLFDRMNVRAGNTVVINAAAGGVGHLAVQLAAHVGATVIAIASGEWCARLLSMGATHAIDYRKQKIAEEVKRITNGVGADCALDAIDVSTAKELISCLRFGGQICHISATMQLPDEMGTGCFMMGTTAHHVFIPGHFHHGDAQLMRFHDIGVAFDALLASGKVKPLITATIGFDGIKQQLIEQRQGSVKGKVLIKY